MGLSQLRKVGLDILRMIGVSALPSNASGGELFYSTVNAAWQINVGLVQFLLSNRIGDIHFEPGQIYTSVWNATITLFNGLPAFRCVNGATRGVSAVFVVQPFLTGGTATVKMQWSMDATTTGSVLLGGGYSALADGVQFGASDDVAFSDTAEAMSAEAAGTHHVTTLGTISNADLQAGTPTVIVVSAIRRGSAGGDTATTDMQIHDVWLEYS